MDKFNVNAYLRYKKQSDRDELALSLAEQIDGLTESGDAILIANNIDGSFTIRYTRTLGSLKDRDSIFAILADGLTKTVGNDSVVQRHTCRHDSGESCIDKEQMKKGDAEPIKAVK